MGRYTLSMAELAQVLGISKSGAYALASSGELPFPVLRIGRRLVVARREVEEYLGPIDLAVRPAGESAA
jgi:excisionase family DNA binding protein